MGTKTTTTTTLVTTHYKARHYLDYLTIKPYVTSLRWIDTNPIHASGGEVVVVVTDLHILVLNVLTRRYAVGDIQMDELRR